MQVDGQMRILTNAAFRFTVEIDGERQGVFIECTLPNIEWEVEEIKEGGLNTYTHQLPGRRKAARIILKNGVGKSSLLDWYFSTMSESFTRKPVTITLLDPTQDPVLTWHIDDAYPVKWVGPQLKTDANNVAIQSLDLACGEITVSL
jgi:phage tail-like protein